MGETGRPAVRRMGGHESLHQTGAPLNRAGGTLLDFWSWSSSDILGNTVRGVLAEYLVALDLGIADGVRTEWDRCDLRLGETRIEVKSAAYLQSWKQKNVSRVIFGIRPTVGWDAETGEYDKDPTPKRQADVYVFAQLGTPGATEVDPLDVGQWVFYIIPTEALNASLGAQKTLTLDALRRLGPVEARFGGIREAVEKAAATKE
jgi:hypothetical protein